jgi:glycosyltransferase involved in cell wall biosynthesis
LDGETGYFVGHDANELEAAIMKLYNSVELRGKMGMAGRMMVVENFRNEIVWKEIEKLYQR